MPFVETVVGALVGSGIGTAAVTWLMTRDSDKRERRANTSDSAIDALAKLKAKYVAVKNETASDDDLLELETSAEGEVSKCGSTELTSEFDEWRNYGRLYASRDEDTTEERFQHLFEQVRKTLTEAVRKLS